MSEEKRATVNVHSQVDRPIRLHLHQTVDDDGGGRAFLGRELGQDITVNPGHNPGIDKEFFAKWREQNKNFGLLSLLSCEDEA